jgi:hypothetical protein
MSEKKVVRLLEPLSELPSTESGLMKLYEAIGVFDQSAPDDGNYRVVLFGSARVPEKHTVYQAVKHFGISLGENGIDGVSGGGPSLMEAFNAGLLEGKKKKSTMARSYGLSINCYPNEKPNVFLEKEYKHGHYATRLHMFSRLGKSFVVAPLAGVGTLLEVAWILQLLQASQLHDAPLILVGKMWPRFKHWMEEEMLEFGTIKSDDLGLMKCVPSFDHALGLVLEHNRKFKQRLAAG